MTSVTDRYNLSGKRVWIAGHRGMVGQALMRRLAGTGAEILTVDRDHVDLRRQEQVEGWMAATRPQAIFLAAAKVGGILANDTRPAEFLYDNLAIEANIIHAAWQVEVEKLLFLGSSCIYPKLAPQPLTEDALLTAPLEPTNEWYAIAKITGIKLCQAYRRQYGCRFISAMPTNIFGYNDLYDLKASHVIPALIRKADEARRTGGKMAVWGSGNPRREFMFSEDLAEALLFLMETYDGESHVNIGTGTDITIADLARLVAKTVGFEGEIVFDNSKPDGTPRKLLDVSRLRNLGWTATTPLEEGLKKSYKWYLENHENLRGIKEQ